MAKDFCQFYPKFLHMNRRAFLSSAAMVGLAGCSLPATTQGPGRPLKPRNLMAPTHKLTVEGSRVAVEGSVSNDSEQELSFVNATASFFDEAGRLLDKNSVKKEPFAGGTTWQYSVPFEGDDPGAVDRYKLILDAEDSAPHTLRP